MRQIADYELVESLGTGNHGEFFIAVPPARLPVQAEHVAVKVLSGNTGDDAFRRATRELRVFASVQSPYLVTLYDAGQQGGVFYYSMEYFPLGSLEAPAEPLSREEVLRAVSHAARAAHALHEAGIAHRDIKPANILLHEGGGKLSDLGLAQVLNPGLTVTGVGNPGSIEYMDPDIIRGERAARATDIWSLGVTLHQALTGTGVFGDVPLSDPLVAIRTILNKEPALAPSLAPQEQDVISACLAPRGERAGTAEEVAEAIERLMEAVATAGS